MNAMAMPSVKAIFDQAHEIGDPDKRRAFLDRACDGAPELRERVEALLRAFVDAGSFLETPANRVRDTASFRSDGNTPSAAELRDAATAAPATVAPALPTSTSGVDEPGSTIGPYRLVRELGAGGMGAVYLAEQDKPIRRQVALKIIKPGMDSAQVIARFDAERQALTMMDHASIARVYDAGTTAHGRPYFVMELVQGIPLTRFCDDHRLTIRARLGLFITVCHAVQHAHQKGIMHRDIKPSNVLVADADDKPTAKVIDFGLAKAIEQSLTDQSHLTQAGAIIGTLRYMSPEQADFSDQGVDTRTDIYSLGVVLYELLTGSTPLELARPKGDGFLETVMRIREEEAPRPSARVAALGAALPAASAARQLDPARLPRLLRGELDWIALKALEKDRERRYQTARDLARDIDRYLHDEPVEACPPSTGYRLGKFARKHRGVLATVGSIMAMLLLGVAGLTWGIIEVNDAREGEMKQRETAEKALQREEDERKKADIAKEKAQAAERRTRQANSLTWAGLRLLSRAQTKLDDADKQIVRNMEEAYSRLGREESEDRLAAGAEAAFRVATLAQLRGALPEAADSYGTAIKLYRQLAAESDKAEYRNELARCYFDLAHTLRQQGKRADAVVAFGLAVDLHKDVIADFPDEPKYWRELADAYNDLGTMRRDARDYEGAARAIREAVRLGEKAAATARHNLGFRINLAAGYHNLGNLVRDGGDPKTALGWYTKAIKELDPISPRPDNATEYLRNAHWDRANALGQLGKHADAVKDWQHAIKLDQGAAQAHLQRFLDVDAIEQKFKGQEKPTGAMLYETAAVNGRAIKAAADEDETQLKARYIRRTLELLREAAAAGWFRDSQHRKQIESSPDFASLPRADLAQFIDTLRP
jgi:serine/threonine protein kinase/tetratricopeptide (TPR) repeat protein